MPGGWGTPRSAPKPPPNPKTEGLYREFELAGFPQPGRPRVTSDYSLRVDSGYAAPQMRSAPNIQYS